MFDPFAMLGVTPSRGEKEIKNKYRALSLLFITWTRCGAVQKMAHNFHFEACLLIKAEMMLDMLVVIKFFCAHVSARKTFVVRP